VTRTRLVLVCLLTLSALTASVASAQAACDTWKAATSGKWGEASNWSTGKVPGNADEACITLSGTYTVTLEPYTGEFSRPANGDTVKSLTLGGSSGHQTLDIEGQSSISESNEQLHVVSLDVSGATAKINPAGTLMLDATASNRHGKTSGEDTPGGEATFAGTIVNEGHIESQVEDSAFHNNLESGVTNEADAGIQVSSGALHVGYPNTYSVSGSNDGLVTVDPGASLQLSSGDPSGANSYKNDGSVVNDGSITVSGAEATWTQSGGSVSGNEVVMQNGATLADSAGVARFLLNAAGARLTGTIPASQTVTVVGGATFNGTKVSLLGAQLVNDGTLVLDSPGSGEDSGGPAILEDGSIQNNGKMLAQVEDPHWPVHYQVGLTNGPSGTLEVQGGSFDQTAGTPATNEGLVMVGPGSVYLLEEGSTFVNESDGTVSPQIASAASLGVFRLGSQCCNGNGAFTAGGTIAPILLGGFVPAAGQEFQIIEIGGSFSGTFAAVGNGFSADYSHESSESAFVGVVYGAPAAGGGGSTSGSGTGVKGPAPTPTPVARVGSISGGHGNLTVALSCPAGGAACMTATLEAVVTEHLKGSKVTAISAKKKKSAAKTRQVVIASGGASLAAGGSETLTLKLNGAGSALLAKYGKLTAIVTVSAAGKTLDTATVTVQKAKKPKQKK
jgi:hypothetical protein